MSDHIYKHIELTGTSSESSDAAIRQAIAKASETMHGIRWFEVVDQRGHIGDDGSVEQWQVTIKIGIRLD